MLESDDAVRARTGPPPLDPEVVAALAASPVDFAALFGGLSDETVAEVRATLRHAPAAPTSASVERTDYDIPGTDGVVVRVHRPIDALGELPALYWMHGGGFVLGTYTDDDELFDRWCGLGVVVASVEYRLAPETPYPGPLEDCYAGLRWLHEHAADLGVDGHRIGVSGPSAGGTLAAGLCICARDRGDLPIAAQLLIYPGLDDRQLTTSSRWPDPVCPQSTIAYAWTSYLGSSRGAEDVSPYAAPARATDLTNLPPALIVAGSSDPLSDEAIEYAVRLRHAGNSVDLYVYAGAPHGFDRLDPCPSVGVRAGIHIDEWITRHLGERRSGSCGGTP